MTANFVAPVIQENPTGWGPCAVPEKFKDIPYQPFSKGDRLGKVSVLKHSGEQFLLIFAGNLISLYS